MRSVYRTRKGILSPIDFSLWSIRGNTAFIWRFLPKANHINGTWKELIGQTVWLQQPSLRVGIPVGNLEPHCFCADIFRQLFIVTGLQTSEREWQRGQREEWQGRYHGQKLQGTKNELSHSCAPMRTQNNKTKSPKAPSTQALLFWVPLLRFLFPKLWHFYFWKVINTNDPAFTLNFHLSQCKRKAVDNLLTF